jgi:hypothetical protein
MTANVFSKVTRQEKRTPSPGHSDKKGGVVSPHSFLLKGLFGLSGPDGTNISQRCDLFFPRFLDAACHKCEPPKEVVLCDYSTIQFKDFFSQLVESKEKVWDIRVPIKFVGENIAAQKLGMNDGGDLITQEDSTNLFLSRGDKDMIYVVKVSFVHTSWHVECYETNDSMESILGNHQVVRFFSGQR